MENESTRVVVNLTPKSVQALSTAVLVGEDNRTNTINRAIQLYAYVIESMAKGENFTQIIDGKQYRLDFE